MGYFLFGGGVLGEVANGLQSRRSFRGGRRRLCRRSELLLGFGAWMGHSGGRSRVYFIRVVGVDGWSTDVLRERMLTSNLSLERSLDMSMRERRV